MLIDFAITNFRSIKERQVFSMQTVSRITEKSENTIQTGNEQLLRSTVIYGRNASGKSNLMLAADCLFNLVVNEDFDLNDAYQPFKICKNKPDEPIVFEINYYGKTGKKYCYYLSFNDKEIIEENLFHYPEGKKARLYQRLQIDLKTDISSVRKIWKEIYPQHTILSRLRFYKIDTLVDSFMFFRRHFVTQSFIGDESIWEFAIEDVLDRAMMPYHSENLSKLLKVADTGIESLEIIKIKPEDFNLPDKLDKQAKKKILEENKFNIKIKHPIYENGEKIGFVDFNFEDESAGTKKLLLFGSSMLDCLSDGDVLFVDELDKGLHPKLMQAIIRIFNNPKTNPNNAQLVITTHDVSLIGANLFRRDQLWITEKDLGGVSSYYTLADIKGVRADVPFEKYLLNGAFGGTPVINEFDFEFNLERTDEKE
ncbi:MAG: ATP-binding protein [Paludibacter sp.]